MCSVSRTVQWKERISDSDLRRRLNLESIDKYVGMRQLSWAGHVARMPFDRLPRKLLSSWARSPRPPGAPQFTYARGLHKALTKCDIDKSSWHQLAQDLPSWRALIGLTSSDLPPGAAH